MGRQAKLKAKRKETKIKVEKNNSNKILNIVKLKNLGFVEITTYDFCKVAYDKYGIGLLVVLSEEDQWFYGWSKTFNKIDLALLRKFDINKRIIVTDGMYKGNSLFFTYDIDIDNKILGARILVPGDWENNEIFWKAHLHSDTEILAV